MARQQIGTASSRTLDTRYWRGAGEDLVDLGYATRMRRRKGCSQSYRILKALPTKEELDAEVRDHYTRGVDEWLEVVGEELLALKQEMGEWRANMQGTGLDSTDGGQRVARADEALGDVLDSLARMPHLPAPLCVKAVAVRPRDLFVSCSHRKGRKRRSREWRAREVCSILDAIVRSAREVKSRDKRVHEFPDLIEKLSREVEDIDFPKAS